MVFIVLKTNNRRNNRNNRDKPVKPDKRVKKEREGDLLVGIDFIGRFFP